MDRSMLSSLSSLLFASLLVMSSGSAAHAAEPEGAATAELRWTQVMLPMSAPLAAVVATSTEVWAVCTVDGSVWATEDGGARWTRVLGAPTVEMSRGPGGAAGALDGESAALRDDLADLLDAMDGVRADALVEDAAWRLHELDDAPAATTGPLDRGPKPRLWYVRGHGVLASREDGLWRAATVSGPWQRISPHPATAVVAADHGVLWVGDEGGLWQLEPPRGGRRQLGAVGGAVLGILRGAEGPLVLTAQGMWGRTTAGDWRRLQSRSWPASVMDVVEQDDALWVATDGGVYGIDPRLGQVVRVDGGDGRGRGVRVAGTTQPGVLAVLRGGEARQLRWDDGEVLVRVRGLPATASVVSFVAAPVMLVATDDGLFTAVHDLPTRHADDGFDLGLPSITRLMSESAVAEAWMRNAPGRPRSARLLPQVVLELRHDRRSMARVSAAGGLRGDGGGAWSAFVRLVWEPHRHNAVDVLWDMAVDEVDIDALWTALEEGALHDTGAAPGRGAVAHAGVLQARRTAVQALWRRNAALVARRAALAPDALTAQVAVELQLQQVRAELDVWTRGAVARWERSRSEGPEP